MKLTFWNFSCFFFKELTWYENGNQLCFQAHLRAVWNIMALRFIFLCFSFLLFSLVPLKIWSPCPLIFLSKWNLTTANRKGRHFQGGKWKHSLKEGTDRILLATAQVQSMGPTTIKYLNSLSYRMWIHMMLVRIRGKLVQLRGAK